jgi:hypothetical protein
MITLDDMREKLIPLSEAQARLAESEPLREYNLDEGNVRFVLADGWNHGLDAKDGAATVDAAIVLGGAELYMSKDAMLQATSLCGLPAAYVKKTPAKLIEPQLNYWYNEQGIGNRPAKLLVTKGQGAAVTRQSIKPFSNLRILDSVIDGIHERFGDEEILVDTKFHHALAGTHMRLILPSQRFQVQDTGVDEDEWLIGLNIYNSLTGKGKTSVNGYLFRWWCTNGAIDTKASSGTWTRNSYEEGKDVYDWAREVVNSVLDPMEESKVMLQDMAHTPIGDDINQILLDLFEDYTLPARDRKRIIENMVEEDNLTMYALMQAVTNVANDESMDPMEQARLMSVGGDLPHVASHRCDSCHRIKPAV